MHRACPAILVVYLAISSGNAWESIPRITVFPQIAIGGSWSSDFFITNQGLAAVNGCELSLFKDSGDPMLVDTPDLGMAATFKFSLQPGETRVIHATRGPEVSDVAGFAELFCPPETGVKATMIVRYAPGGQPVSQLGLLEQFPFSHFSFPGEVGAQANTGIAIAIPTFRYSDIPDQKILVSILEANGALLDTKQVPLSAGKHTAFFLGDLFPDLRNFSGRVMLSGADWLGVTAVRIEGATLGGVAVDEGVALGPFIVSGDAIAEVEPNDDPNAAQAITPPAVVSAVIASSTEVDYYRFTGRQGDIVSALVETSSSGSPDLDSQLSLLNAAGVEMAWNDQNGIGGASRNDSFIRIVLPAAGVYYLRVSDYEGNGGASFGYRLHLKIQTP